LKDAQKYICYNDSTVSETQSAEADANSHFGGDNKTHTASGIIYVKERDKTKMEDF